MTAGWSAEDLQHIDEAAELEIAAQRADGTRLRWTPIWVVGAKRQVYVRTWHRRATGWFGHALRSQRAQIRVPGLEADVLIEDVGAADADLCADVDAAYRSKYRPYGATSVDQMVGPDAAASTLRLVRQSTSPTYCDDRTGGTVRRS